MKATLETVFEDMNELQMILRMAGEDSKRLNSDQKMIMSETLAFLVYEVRRKYELTSGLYCIAENQAVKKYRKIYE